MMGSGVSSAEVRLLHGGVHAGRRECDVCGRRVPKGSRTDKQYCSDKCRQVAYRRRKKEAA